MTYSEQTEKMLVYIDQYLDIFENNQYFETCSISDRPFFAVVELLKTGIVRLGYGDGPPLDMSNPLEHMKEPGFRAIYAAVEAWYEIRYGKGKVQSRSGSTLTGVVFLRSVPYGVKLPKQRSIVEKEGEFAWMCLEDSVQPEEDCLSWLEDAPDPVTLNSATREKLRINIKTVAGSLRFIHFRTSGVRGSAAKGYAKGVLKNLESAATHILSPKNDDFGLGWPDLQMAAECSLKLILAIANQEFAKGADGHDLRALLRAASQYGVAFEERELDGWPPYSKISDLKYLQENSKNITHWYKAYKICLDLSKSCFSTIQPIFGSGSRILFERPPYLYDRVPDQS